MKDTDVGILIQGRDIKLHRHYFKEMCSLIGIQALYRAPLKDKSWDGFGELDTAFQAPELIGCIFDEHPNQKTMKKMGWVAELQEGSSIIHVPYDLKDLQVGALFIIPSGLDHAKGRVFKVISMENIAVYPASIACEIAPVYENNFDRNQLNHVDNNFNLLTEENDNFMLLKEDERDDA
jgi:hypothetical protein